jgi:hypothetical protein
MRPRNKKRSSRKASLLLALAAVVLSGAIFLAASGRWWAVYAFIVQFHQQTLWAGFVLLFVPTLIFILFRAWGVEDIPYVEEVPELGSGRLQPLVRQIDRSRRDAYDQALLINELAELATQVIALNEGVDASEARRLCRSGEWAKDEVILDLIRHRRIPATDDRRFIPEFEQILHSIERRLKGGTDIESHPSR